MELLILDMFLNILIIVIHFEKPKIYIIYA